MLSIGVEKQYWYTCPGEWKGEKIPGDFPLGEGQFSSIYKWVKFCSISWVDGGYFEKSWMKTEQTTNFLGPIFLMLHCFYPKSAYLIQKDSR